MESLPVLDSFEKNAFPPLNHAYASTFRPGRLSLGLVVPIERYATSAVPTMDLHLETAQHAEALGFSALWLRDVPFNVPSFGDAGQIFDPFVYLGALATSTRRIALGVASIILPLRHPAHVAKAAASADVLSNGRLLLGVASGDRPEEYPALDTSFEDRGRRFRESVAFMEALTRESPQFSNTFGRLPGTIDMLPKPTGGRLPMLITGGSQQTPDWVARHCDGWMTYPRNVTAQGRMVSEYRQRVAGAGEPNKPVIQSLYVDLMEDPDALPQPIHLGFRSGANFLRTYLQDLERIGINHVALNLRFNTAEIPITLKRLAADLLPDFTIQD